MEKRGRIKYSDPEKGYGYIVEDGATSASETTLFDVDDADAEIDELIPGTPVVFDEQAGKATQVKKA